MGYCAMKLMALGRNNWRDACQNWEIQVRIHKNFETHYSEIFHCTSKKTIQEIQKLSVFQHFIKDSIFTILDGFKIFIAKYIKGAPKILM